MNRIGFHDKEAYSTGQHLPPTSYYVDDVRVRRSTAAKPDIVMGGVEDPIHKSPIAQNDWYTIRAGTLTVNTPGVLSNDTDPQQLPLSATALTVPAHGTLQFNANGSFVYTPSPDFVGIDSFTYVVDNGYFSSNVATVTITVSKWMDQNWGASRSVSISNPCGGTCNDYQVRITLNSSFDFSKALSDGSDLRVTASDGSTLIPFWIESWDPVAQQASLWVKVPTIPPGGTTVYLYYGNLTPPSPPGPTIVNLPPVGPWTFPPNNLIAPIGDSGGGSNLLAENIVYDDPAQGGDGKYWLVFANYRDKSIGLAWSTTPADPSSWTWNPSNPVITNANAPFLIKDGNKWYIFFADRTYGTNSTLDLRIATANSPAGPYTRVPAETSIVGTSVTLTPGSTSVDGVGTGFTTQLAVGKYVKMTADNPSVWSRICSITSNTSATLCEPYTGQGGTGDAHFNAGGIVLWPTEAWESYRVDEPFVLRMPDGTYLLIYMADSGGNVEQNGYATAPSITGPYTKYGGNPALPFGPDGSYDHGTVADPWIYPVGATYYIGYSANLTGNPPWHTGLITTTDFKTFTREGVTLTAPNRLNSFRGGITRVANTLLFTYTGNAFDSRIATQPATATLDSIINNPRAVFDFYDHFNGTALDPANWATGTQGTGGTVALTNGSLILTAQSTRGTSGTVQLLGPSTIGKGSILEVLGRHLDAGLNSGPESNAAFGLGFATADMANVIGLLDFPDLTKYTVQATKLGGGSYVTSPVSFDRNGDWHTYRIYRDAVGSASFSIDGSLISALSANVPDWKLPPMLLSYARDPAPQSRFEVQWVRVRQGGATDPTVVIGSEKLPSGDRTPIAFAQSVSTPHDVPVTITLVAYDGDNDPLTYSVASAPVHGVLTGSAPNLTYTPAPNYHGKDAFTFRAFDGQGYSAPATVAIAVTYLNHAPVSSGQSLSLNEDSHIAITLSATDPDADPLTYTIVSGPSSGTLTGSLPNLIYTPTPLYHGSDQILFKATDGLLDSDVATIVVTVNHVNHAPVANDDSYYAVANQTLSVAAPGLLGNDVDVDRDVMRITLVSSPTHGSVVLFPNGAFRYVGSVGYSGNDSFTYKINDGTVDSNIGNVSIFAGGWFDAEWTARRPATVPNPCAAVCSDYQVQLKLNASNFNFSKANSDGSDIQITDRDGTTVLPFWIENWNAATSTASIWVKIPSIPTGGTVLHLYYGNPNPPARIDDPAQVFDFYDGFDGTAVDATKWTTNMISGSITLSSGVAVLTSTNNYTQLYGKPTFNPNDIVEVYGRHENQGIATALFAVGWRTGTDFNNTTRLMDWSGATGDETKYHAASSGGNTTTLFSGYKDSATAADKNFHTFGVYRSAAGTADFRVDGSSVMAPLVGSPYVLTSAMPLWIGTYATGTTSKFDVDWARVRKFYGSDPLVTIGAEQSHSANGAPTAVDDAYSATQDNTLTIAAPGVLSNDADPDGDPLTSVLVGSASHGAITLNANGSFVYVPAAGYHGPDSFTYQAHDSVLTSNVATVTISVATGSKRDQTITFGTLASKTYSDPPFDVSATASSGLPVSFTVGASDNCTISGNTVTITGAGNCTVTAHQAGNDSYNPAPDLSERISIGKATASVVLSNLTQTYDGTAKSVTAATTPVGLSVNITYGGSTTVPLSAGSYAVEATVNESNYQGAASATLTVAKATASVTPAALGKTYGAADPALTGTLTGFVPADNVTATYTRNTGETVAGGPYVISATLSPPAALANYAISYNTAVFTIVPALASVTPNAASKVYGSGDPVLTGSLTGFLQADGVTATYTRAPGTIVGSYPITSTLSLTGALSNYSITYNTAALTIVKALLTVTANNLSKSYGAVNPPLTYIVTGFVLGETQGVLSGAPTLATAATQTSLPGTYPITIALGSLAAANYTFAFVDGLLTITPVSSVTLSPAAWSFGNQLVGTTSTGQAFTLKIAGPAAVTITSIATAGANAADFSWTTTCGTSLAAAASCTITVRYKPAVTGPESATLVVADSDLGSPQSAALSGNGIAPTLSVSPPSLSFSSPLGFVTSAQQVSISNTGSAPLSITSISLSGTNRKEFAQTTTCGSTVAAGGRCTVDVVFAPTSASPAIKTASLAVGVAAPANSQSVGLTGTLVAPTYSLTPTSLAFGTVTHGTVSPPQSITLTNTSPLASVTVKSITKAGSNPGQFDIQSTNCVGAIAAGATCAINVAFIPSSTGAKIATINVNVAAPGSSSSVPVSGTGK